MNQILETADGRPVAQANVDPVVANAEGGFLGAAAGALERPSTGRRPALTVAVRLNLDLDAALLDRLARTGETASGLTRAALREYLCVARRTAAPRSTEERSANADPGAYLKEELSVPQAHRPDQCTLGSSAQKTSTAKWTEALC